MVQPASMIVFLSDNHNRSVTGCYGHPLVKTPNIDRIAAMGIRFQNSYSTSALCCPARSAIATGRYAHQTGYWDNALTYDGRVPSWHHRLREQGHTVTAVGKLHFRSSEDDNGFTDELVPMHLHEGKGAIKNLMRGYDREPPRSDTSFWDLYDKRSGVGEAPYQEYDRKVTTHAIEWLKKNARRDKPWLLLVSYASPHPPFTVPKRLYELYPEDQMPLPPAFRKGERPEHPAAQHLRAIDGIAEMTDERMLRRVAAGYFGLITHMDEQIGQVLKVAENLGLFGRIRLGYTSDHGELFGAQGIFGKKNLYEGSVGVPLVFSGPGIPEGGVLRQIASHVDLFPTLIEGAGAKLTGADGDLPGVSLFPAMEGRETDRVGFAEYHAQGSRAGQFMLREGDLKLIYHVGMPSQLFDLGADPEETRDLVASGAGRETGKRLEARLRMICDPEATDKRAKADQRAAVENLGGPEAVLGAPAILFTPPPGVSAADAWKLPASPANR